MERKEMFANGVSASTTHIRPHIFVFDYMRTRSNLFWRWISTHPSLYTTYHPYLMAGFLGPARITQWTRNSLKRKEDIDALIKHSPTDETFDSSSFALEKEVERAEHEVSRLKHNSGKEDELLIRGFLRASDCSPTNMESAS